MHRVETDAETECHAESQAPLDIGSPTSPGTRVHAGRDTGHPLLDSSVVFRSLSWSMVTQPAGDHRSHKPGGKLPLYFARPAVTYPAAKHHRPLAGTKLYCLVSEVHDSKQLVPSRYVAIIRPEVERATVRFRVRHVNAWQHHNPGYYHQSSCLRTVNESIGVSTGDIG